MKTVRNRDRCVVLVGTFARLYGYIRYFHPSDEAASLDWDRFAVHGVQKMLRIGNRAGIKSALEKLFLPVAPTMRLYTGRPPRPERPECPPPAIGAGPIISWQHLGVTGLSQSPGIYRSIRTNRITVIKDESGRNHRLSSPIFKAKPRLGEATLKPIGNGLWCRVPLALVSVNGHTWSPCARPRSGRMRGAIPKLGSRKMSPSRLDVRLADVIIAWNILRHFYPYAKEMPIDWSALLLESIGRAFLSQTPIEFEAALTAMLERTGDGHASVHYLGKRPPSATCPFYADWARGKLVISWADGKLPIRPGDIVTSIDGEALPRALKIEEDRFTGSEQLKRLKALRWGLWWGPRGSKIWIGVRRGSRRFTARIARTLAQPPDEPRKYNPIQKITPATWYVDLTRAKWRSIRRKLRILSRSYGLVLDLRGYPAEWDVTVKILAHLLKRGNTPDSWYRTPRRIYPDQERPAGYEPGGWSWLKPSKPRFGGRIALLTNAATWSQGECIVSFFAPCKLGTVVGQTTAGSNGDVAEFILPGGYKVGWTGARVVKHDGSRFHALGFKPDIRVERTVQGILDGRDEFVERAVAMLERGNSKPRPAK